MRRRPALAEEVRATLRALLPAVAESLTPPDRDGTDWDALGASGEEIRDFALDGLVAPDEHRGRAAHEPLTDGTQTASAGIE